jgi:hypothetical protein
MPRNGSGVYSPPAASYPAVSGTLIESAKRNAVDADIATALTNSIAVNGESVVTNNIPLGGNKLTGVGAATASTDAMTLLNAQNGTGVYVATVGGTADVITISPSPVIASYVTGQMFSFIASGANTTNVTINVNGLGAKAVTKNGTTALVAGDIPSGFLVSIRYDGTRFQLVGSASTAFNGGTLTGDITMSASSIIEAEGAAVASASSTNIWATDGNTRHITGNTTINDFGTAPQVGARMKLIFDGTPTLTQSANLNLNGGGSNIIIAADDWAEVYADTTTQFDVVVHRKSGKPIVTADDTAYAASWNGNLDAPTKNAVYDKIETLLGVGIGQTWSDVTGSRISGTTYTNSTGKPIMVSVEAIWAGAGVVVGGVNICSPATTQSMGYSFIVPDSTTYVVTTSGIGTWAELR